MRKSLKFDPVRQTTARPCNQFRWARDRVIALAETIRRAGPVVATAALLTSAATAALAADMALKAPQATVYQWSGCYVGANVGGGASGSNFGTAVDPGTHLLGGDPAIVAGSGSGAHSEDGLLAGGQAGCNWQSGLFVAGLEGDFDYFHSNPWYYNNTNTLTDGSPFLISQSLTTDYLATIRPRIGIAADRNLAYLTAGVAFTRVSYLESYNDGSAFPGTGSAAASKSLVGWVAGAGWEYAMTDHWIFRAEYLFASFGQVSAVGAITDAAGGANTLHGSSDLTIQALRAAVNYKF
jgi:outer membrane immunogenic protein